ncbi:hemicentin-1-like [Scyliorhinus canicula]|uniref:hemicentin-1-like n=1 Tax=Scyliorhinus canicula TaxID=7830 RepID=UPI0018F61C25|nr:hemicentin-1-like [Scyliorhinus canicula]
MSKYMAPGRPREIHVELGPQSSLPIPPSSPAVILPCSRGRGVKGEELIVQKASAIYMASKRETETVVITRKLPTSFKDGVFMASKVCHLPPAIPASGHLFQPSLIQATEGSQTQNIKQPAVQTKAAADDIIAGFEEQITANPPAVAFGDSLTVNCSTTCTNNTIILEAIRPYQESYDAQWRALSFSSIQSWTVKVTCLVKCQAFGNQMINVSEYNPTVYNREINITSPPEVLEVNRTYSLECIGPRVYPNNKLILTWLRGSEIVQINSTGKPGLPAEDLRLRNVFSFTASVSDDGQEYTCLAEVDLGLDSRKPIANSSVTLQVHYEPIGTTVLANNNSISGESPVHFPHGDSIVLSCNSRGNPQPDVTWEYPELNNVEITSGILYISGATTKNNGIYKCTATNKLGADKKSVNIKIEGSDFIRKATLELSIKLTLDILQLDTRYQGVNISQLCQKKQLDRTGAAKRQASQITTVQMTRELVENECLQATEIKRTQTKMSSGKADCRDIIAGFEEQITVNPPAVAFGDSLTVNCSTTCTNNTIILEAIRPYQESYDAQWRALSFSSIQSWTVKVTCLVKCQAFGNQMINVSEYNPTVYKHTSLECIGPRVYPNNKLILTWLRGSEIVQINSTGKPGLPDEDLRLKNVFSFTASVSDDGQEYTCLAEVDLGLDSRKPIANSSVTLQVHYEPIGTTVLANNNSISGESPVHFPHGDSIVLSCNSRGNPQPDVTWEYPELNNVEITSGILYISGATTKNNGIYKCTATNKLGADKKSVNIKIEDIIAGFEEQITVNPPAVAFGDSLTANCSTTCTNNTIILEAIRPYQESHDAQWRALSFSSIQSWTVKVTCLVKCQAFGNQMINVSEYNPTVYNREINITSPPEVLEVNRTYSLECIGPRVYPNNKLILTWLRGSEIVQINSTGKPGLPDKDLRLRNVFSFTASVSDDGQEYTCLAEVDLGLDSRKQITNSSVTLQTFSFMDPPRIFDQRPVEVKQEVTLTCEVSNVYPVDTMRVRLSQAGEELNSTTTWFNGNTAWQTAAWTPQVAGPTEIVCTADFEEYPSVPPKNSSIFIVVYDQPGNTTISVNNKTVSGFPVNVRKGDEVTMICNSNGIPTPTLKWEDPSNSSNVEIGSPGILRISHATSEHQGIYKCRATNPYGIEEKEVDIRVTDKPGDITISVNNKTVSGFPVNVRKGDEVTMICNSNGNPTPTLKWEDPSNSSNVEIGSPGILRISHATSGHQGIYKCRATNPYGIEEKEVDIRVTDKPGNTTISVNNKTVSGFPVNVRKGDEVTMICNSNGNPTPTLKWEDPRNSSNVEIGSPGILRISHATSGHQGIYKCRATNPYGIEEQEVDIRVTDKPGNTTISVNNKTVSGFPVNVRKGDEVTMICNSNGNPTPTLKWEDPSNSSNVEIGSPGILRISHATSGHQGIYKCRATNQYGIEEMEVDIRVTDKPGDTTISVNNKTVSGFPVNVRKGDEVTMICNSNGNPTPTLKWEDPRNSSNVEIGSPGILRISHATSGHQGIYKCRATNPYGIEEQEVDIRVTDKPGNTTISVNNKTVSGFPVNVRKGDEVTMICNSNGNPTPTLKWEDPSNSSNVEIGSPGILRISHATSGHQGIYKCRATNQYGIEEMEVDIRVTDKPGDTTISVNNKTVSGVPVNVRKGDEVTMICNSNGIPTPTLKWEDPSNSSNVEIGPPGVLRISHATSGHQGIYKCRATNQYGIEEKEVDIRVTDKPGDTTISVNIKTVSGFPVNVRKGDEVTMICNSNGIPTPTLKWEDPTNGSNVEIGSPGVLRISHATSGHQGIYKCRATNPYGIEEKEVDIRVTDKPGDTTISVNHKTVSGVPVNVRKGDEVTMICNSNGNPTPTLKWENPRNSSNVEIGSPGVLRISHATSGHQGIYKCRATNQYGIEEKEVDIRVTDREINITSPPGVLEVNRRYSLECIGPRVYPNNKLILTWLRGSEIVQINSTGKPGLPDEDLRLRNVFSFTASVSDDGQEYTCLAEVDLGLDSRKPIANSSVTLQTFSFMDPPRIFDQRPVEVKQEVTLTCEVSNVYPVDTMRVRLSQAGEELNSTTTWFNGNTVRQTAAWTPQVAGPTEIVCTADFEEYPSVPPKNSSIFIVVYVFSDPEIQLPVSLEGNLVNVTCSVFNVSGQLQLRLKNGGDILANELSNTGMTIYHTLDAQAHLDKQQYVCEAEMKLRVQSMASPIVKKQVATLRILYKPGDTSISVNNKTVSGFPVNISKGDEVTMICNSNGNPTPTLKWEDPSNSRKVEIGPPGILRISHATSGHQGIYKCRATNPYGIEEMEVDIRVTAIVTGFEIRININPPAVEFGDSLEMNCTTTCPDPIINVEYKPGIHPNRTTGSNWITDYFPSVQAWDFTAPCNVICESQNHRSNEEKKVVTVYNREINITSAPEVLEVNRTYSLECIGPRVYPNNKLILTWLRGSEIVQINSTGKPGLPDEDLRLRNVFSFTASVSDDGQEYTCLAEVDLGLNSTKPIANSSVTLQVHYKPGDTTISVNNKTVSGVPVNVRKGDEVTMICNSNGNPTPTLKWEDPSNSSNVEIGSPGVLRISHATSGHQGIYKCRATNQYGIEEKEVDIRVTAIVTGFEIRININPPAVEFGDSLEMNCTTTCPDPIINVEYKPGIHPNRKTGSNWITDYFPSVQAWDFTAPCNVICKSQNHRSNEGKKVVTVYNREINITSPPEVLEVNRRYSLECIGPRVYPNNKLILTWLRGSEIVQINSTGKPGLPDKDLRLRNVFSFTASVSDDGQEYTCLAEVDLDLDSRKPIANSSVTLQVHYKPGDTTISVNHKTVSGFPVNVRKGDEVTMICNSNGNPTPTLKWEDPSNGSNVEIGSPGILRISHATSGHQGIYKCRATNQYGIEEKEVDIRVTDKPGDTTISVNNKTVSGFPVNVRKGDEVTMICNSNGIPTPTLKWEDPSNGNKVEIGSPGVLRISYATSEHQGIYQCRATNPYGIEEKEVDIRVTDKPGDTTISVNNKTVSGFPVNVRKGDEVTMICNSNGNPTPTLKWEDPSNGNKVEIGSPGVLRISYATSGHQGIYQCRATNPYGIEEKEVDIRVTAIVTGFEIMINTNPPAVEFGDSLEMNCTTTCPDPIINVEYKPGIHPNRTTGSNWTTDYFPSVQAWDFTAPCNVICISQNYSSNEGKKVVTVYNREINITSLPEVLEVNRRYSLECIGPRVYPNNKLILTWLRGSEIVQINSTGKPGLPDKDLRLRNVFSFTASVSDDGQEYTCLAEVDLGLNSTKQIANSSVTLQVHNQPGDTTISVNNKTVSGFPVNVRKGDEVTMICNSNGNPTPTLKWEDPSNGSKVEIGSPGVLRISHATSEHQGIYKCRATNPYGIEEKEVDIRVTGQTPARRLAAKVIGITSVVIVVGAFLLSILTVCFRK